MPILICPLLSTMTRAPLVNICAFALQRIGDFLLASFFLRWHSLSAMIRAPLILVPAIAVRRHWGSRDSICFPPFLDGRTCRSGIFLPEAFFPAPLVPEKIKNRRRHTYHSGAIPTHRLFSLPLISLIHTHDRCACHTCTFPVHSSSC